MKTEKIAPWVFFCIAMLVFVIFILLTFTITSVLASSYTQSAEGKDYSLQAASSSYLPLMHRAAGKDSHHRRP